MSKDEFKEDQEVKAIFYPDESCVIAGRNGVEKITVVLEKGQMAFVAWFAVWKNGEIFCKHNGAHLAQVQL